MSHFYHLKHPVKEKSLTPLSHSNIGVNHSKILSGMNVRIYESELMFVSLLQHNGELCALAQ